MHTDRDYRALYHQQRREAQHERARRDALEAELRALELQLNEAEWQRDEARLDVQDLRVRLRDALLNGRGIGAALAKLMGCCN